jgi:hypothetical protein
LVDAVLPIAHQSFAGNLQQHTLVFERGGGLGFGFGEAHGFLSVQSRWARRHHNATAAVGAKANGGGSLSSCGLS